MPILRLPNAAAGEFQGDAFIMRSMVWEGSGSVFMPAFSTSVVSSFSDRKNTDTEAG